MARIILVLPVPKRNAGNGVTADRWARILRRLGHRVITVPRWTGQACDLLIALHARKSAGSVRRFRRAHPAKPIVVALTGTDLYQDLPGNRQAERSLDLADVIVALQPRARLRLPRRVRSKLVVIHQSVSGSAPSVGSVARGCREPRPGHEFFDVLVLAHLRAVKDPLRAAQAARLLPASSRVRVLHAGRPLTKGDERRLRVQIARNPRFRWLGDLSRARARRALRQADLLVVPSRSEGGANVVSEAASLGVPILASRIEGTVGLLGTNYPGYFPVGDTQALSRLVRRAESEPRFLDRLRREVRKLTPLITPAREVRAWSKLLRSLSSRSSARVGGVR